MQKWTWPMMATWLLLANLAFAGGVDNKGRELYRDGEIIVKFRDDSARARMSMRDLYQRLGVVEVKRFSGAFKNFEHLYFNKKANIHDVIDDVQRDPAVEYAQPNYMIYALPHSTEDVEAQAEPCVMPGVPFPPGCEDSGDGGGGLPLPPGGGDGGGGFPIPPGDGGGNPGEGQPCLIPGFPFPPGCVDNGNPGPVPPGPGPGPSPTPGNRPAIPAMPAEPAGAADPNLDKTYGLRKIQAPEAWAIQPGSKDVVVAVIDTGVDYTHPDLAFNIWRNPAAATIARTGVDPNGSAITGDVVGWDFVHNDNLPFDDNMHGTHCAGTVGAVGNDGVGISGVAQRVSIMAVKFLSKEGSGDTADAIKSIDYAVDRGAKILSNSWGGKGDDGGNKALEDAIRRAEARGVLFVAAAGNDSTNNDSDPVFPATLNVPNILAVAATNESDGMAFFSNYGRTTVHVGAPGSNVYSTKPGGGYQKLSGTSMAAPHVAGAAALVLAQYPNAGYAELKRRLMEYGDAVPALNNKTVTGKRINVLKALQGN